MRVVDNTPWLVLPADSPDRLPDDLMVSLILSSVPSRVRLADAAALLSGPPLVLVLPVERASFTVVSLPPGGAALQRQALPYTVEPLLAEDVELLHLALGAPLADGRWPVAAVNRALLQGWLAQLASRGLQVARIHVDADLLPGEGTVVWWDAQRCLIGGRAAAPMVFAPAHWPLLQSHCGEVQVLLDANADAASLDVPGGLPVQAAQWPQVLQDGQATAIDLAQGALATRGPAAAGRWRPLAVVLAVLGLLQLGLLAVQGWVHDKQAQAYQQANLAIYQGLFPQDTRIVNLRAQFDQHLLRQQAGNRLVEQLEGLDAALADSVATQLEAIDYRAADGRLQLTLQAGSGQALAQVQAAIDQGQLAIGVQLAGQQADDATSTAAGAAQ